MKTHTPTPWVAELSTIYRQMEDWPSQDNADPICSTIVREDASFIVEAVNSHQIMLDTLKELASKMDADHWFADQIKNAIAIGEGKQSCNA